MIDNVLFFFLHPIQLIFTREILIYRHFSFHAEFEKKTNNYIDFELEKEFNLQWVIYIYVYIHRVVFFSLEPMCLGTVQFISKSHRRFKI